MVRDSFKSVGNDSEHGEEQATVKWEIDFGQN